MLPYSVILASNSPRRTQLLTDAGIPHVVFASDVDESLTPDLRRNPEKACQTLAERKATAARKSYFSHLDNQEAKQPERTNRSLNAADSVQPAKYLFIGSDTMVVEGGEIFGKPIDRADAEHMLQRLSGVTHQVMTSVSLQTVDTRASGQLITDQVTIANFVDISLVTFRELTDLDIASYLDTGESFGKAGAYAIQGIGASLVDHVEGDLDTVIGLPVQKILREYPQFFR